MLRRSRRRGASILRWTRIEHHWLWQSERASLICPIVAYRGSWCTLSCRAVYTEQVDHIIPLNGNTVCRPPRIADGALIRIVLATHSVGLRASCRPFTAPTDFFGRRLVSKSHLTNYPSGTKRDPKRPIKLRRANNLKKPDISDAWQTIRAAIQRWIPSRACDNLLGRASAILNALNLLLISISAPARISRRIELTENLKHWVRSHTDNRDSL